MSAIPCTARGLKPRLPKFRAWLEARGASLLVPTNEWELLRFKTGTATAVIYTSKLGGLTFTGESRAALEAFVRNDPWRAAPATKRGKKVNGPIYQALRQRDGDACFFCLRDVSEDEESIEHLISVTHQGPDHMGNYVLAHRACNAQAGHLSAMEKIAMHVAAHAAKARAALSEAFDTASMEPITEAQARRRVLAVTAAQRQRVAPMAQEPLNE